MESRLTRDPVICGVCQGVRGEHDRGCYFYDPDKPPDAIQLGRILPPVYPPRESDGRE